MRRSPLTASAFALAAGRPADARAFVHVEALAADRSLAIAVEPIEFSPRGAELAILARETIRESLLAEIATDPGAALARAFARANAALVAENRPSAGCRWERRVFAGATAAIIHGRRLVMAQVPPAQALVVQERRLYAFPRLDSWRTTYLPPDDAPEPDPLGFGEGGRPLLFRSAVAPGDLLILCSSSIGRLLAAGGGANRLLRHPALLDGDQERALDLLAELVARSDLDDAFVAGLAPRGALPERAVAAVPAARTAHARAASVAPFANAVGRTAGPAGGRGSDRRAAPNTRRPRRLGLPSGLRFAVLALLEAALPRRRPGAPALVVRQRGLAAPGASSVERHRAASSAPGEWRTHLPRTPELHVPSRLLAVGLVAILGLGATRVYLERQHDRTERAEAAIGRFDDALLAASDPARSDWAIAEAQSAFEEALAAGATPDRLLLRGETLDTARDQAWQIGRLEGLTRIGVLPDRLAGPPVRLVWSRGEPYLVAGGLYRIDADGRRLIEELAPGAAVDGATVGTLYAATSDGAGLLATDGRTAFRRDRDGTWRRHPLSGLGAVAWSGLPAAAFDGSLYGIADGRLLKFGAGDGAEPTVWARADDIPDLARARDLSIDGRIYLLLDDGRVLTLLQGALIDSKLPELQPSLRSSAFLAATAGTEALYVVDRDAAIGACAGRIVRLAPDGSTRQYLVPDPGASGAGAATARLLADARHVAVNEETGIVFVVTETELWRATLPGADAADRAV